jgi:putative ABC transport system substrate-binding protein
MARAGSLIIGGFALNRKPVEYRLASSPPADVLGLPTLIGRRAHIDLDIPDPRLGDGVERRRLVAALGSAIVLLPLVGIAAPAHARIGWLAHGDTMPRHFFDNALKRLGWIEDQNLTVDRRFSGSAGEQIDQMAAELVASHPDVIVAMGTIDAYPVLALTRTIPIVVVTSADPVRQGLAVSLARPGRNVTGTAATTPELLPKLLQLAQDLVPRAGRVSVLGDPRNPGYVEPPASVAEALGITMLVRRASRPDELDEAFAAAAADGDQIIVVQFSALSFEERWRVVSLAARFRLPSIYPTREYVEAGGLLSYGPVIRDNFERAAVLVDKILRGASPAELPIEQPTHFELVINLKTAKALGLTVPQSLLQRADEVIE